MNNGGESRKYWLSILDRIARPVMENLAEGRLKASMPLEVINPEWKEYAHLEAFGRSLAGIAGWLETEGGNGEEQALRHSYRRWTIQALDKATDPSSPDFMNFSRGNQPLVDASFLAWALVKAPRTLWEPLEKRVKNNVIAALQATHICEPSFNNWLLFAAMVETALYCVGEPFDAVRIDYALRQHDQWYKGDGLYADGPEYQQDYYNSYVIHPMMLDILNAAGDYRAHWQTMQPKVIKRARRYAAILERMISPEGAFPPLGRTITSRFGAFQLLSMMAVREDLPEGVSPAQVRCGLTAVIRRMMGMPGNFDADGWLKIGFCGSQPRLAEHYNSTGTGYMCLGTLSTLALPPDAPFWSADDEDWTAKKIWDGRDVPGDHGLKELSH